MKQALIRKATIVLLFLAASAALAEECPSFLDWNRATEVARGVKRMTVTIDTPRLMVNYLLRVDLHEKGLHVVGTGRAAEWGRPMEDFTNSVVLIETRREQTRDFIRRYRAGGTNMVAAINTSAFVPWVKPFNHRYGAFRKFLASNGEAVSHTKERGPMLVVFTNNTAVITETLDDAELPAVAVAHPGYDAGIILRGGKIVKPTKPLVTSLLAPRTAFGLSADGRYLYALVVDGRQKGYSLGADMTDLARMLKVAGAADAINMDGGGSSTLAYWDAAKGEVAISNRHDGKGRNYRDVAASIGIVLDVLEKQ